MALWGRVDLCRIERRIRFAPRGPRAAADVGDSLRARRPLETKQRAAYTAKADLLRADADSLAQCASRRPSPHPYESSASLRWRVRHFRRRRPSPSGGRAPYQSD
eukprot:816246-Prorocentrum_minimum.AAC.1